jgi:hypothetical protein
MIAEPPLDAVERHALELTANELFALGVIVGEPLLIGIDDPFADPSIDRVELFERGRARLMERDIVRSIDDRDIIHPTMLPVAYTIFYPDATFIGSSFTPALEHFVERTFHLQGDLAIRITALGDERYRLDALDGLSEIEDHLEAIWNLGSYQATEDRTVELPLELFEAVESADALIAAGVAETEAHRLVSALRQPLRRGQVLALRRMETTWQANAIGFIADRENLWRVKALDDGDDARVELSATDTPSLLDDLSNLIAALAFADGDLYAGAAT